MDGYSISHAAERTGFSASALRFYERHDLVRPDRAPSGYRRYDEADIETLRFIGRAKSFGLSLDEITDLVPLVRGQQCAPVQDRLRDLLATRIKETQARIEELISFTAELRRAEDGLLGSTPDGPCDDTCGCITDTSPDTTSTALVTLGTKPTTAAPLPIACTLVPDQLHQRLDDWQTLLADAVHRQDIPAGVRLQFPPTVDVAAITTLAAAEQACCGFFTFTLTIAAGTVTLDITAPDDAQPMVDALVGAAT